MSTPESQLKEKQQVAVEAGKRLIATEEQTTYAKILDIGMKIGLIAIIVAFFLYAFGILSPKIPVTEVSKYWGMKSHDYLEAVNIQPGWSWLSMYKHGDFLNFFPIAFLAGLTIVCYVAIIPILIRKKDAIYAVLALLEVLVLLGAASGLLAAGGH
ncbi:MAG: hypothetical protein QME63_00420 [Actinomycetota bacterium]|nr:hypothetical protein [Actinomycetota bacterium]